MTKFNYAQLLTWASGELCDSESPELDAQVLLSHATGKDATHFIAWPDKTPTEDQQLSFQHLVIERKMGKPIAHILGYKEFWSLNLMTNDSTLIPRPDTEVLVEVTLDVVTDVHADVVDLGTGTGAIAIALASEKPSWTVLGIEKNPEAVTLASENVKARGYNHVTIQEGDWLSGIQDHSLDVIVSNPPYIEEGDRHLSEGDVRFEPKSALVAGLDGLDDYRIIIPEALRCLRAGGYLFLEHGFNQADDLKLLMLHHGFESIETRQDYGGHDRVTFGKKPSLIEITHA